jgi:hypothetical protein
MSDFKIGIRNFRKRLWNGSSFVPQILFNVRFPNIIAVVGWSDLVCCSRSVTGKYSVVLRYLNVCSIDHQGWYRPNGSGMAAGCTLFLLNPTKFIRRHTDSRKLLLMCISLLSRSFVFFRFYIFINIWLYSCLIL